MNSDLKSLVRDLKETTKLANIDVAVGERSTRPGREMARNQARDRVDQLHETYRNAIAQNTFVLMPVGDSAKTEVFAKLATESGALLVDGSEFYNLLALRCKQTMGSTNMFGLTQFMVLENEVRNWARTNKVVMQPLNFTVDLPTPTFEDLTNTVREIVEKTNGQTLVKTYIEGQVFSKAVEQEVDSKVVPVVVVNASDNLSYTNLFKGKGLIVDTNTDITPEFITKTFNQVKKLLKGSN